MRSVLKRIAPLRWLVGALRGVAGFCGWLPGEIRLLRRGYGLLREVDLLLVSGSNQLEDSHGGAWGFPYTVYKWCALARLAGVPIAFASMGATPLESWLSRRFVVWSLGAARYVTFREETSRSFIAGIGLKRPTAVRPDLAYSLPRSLFVTSSPANESRPRIAINVFPHGDPRYSPEGEADAGAYARYVACLASFADSLIDAGCSLSFFCSQRADLRVIEDVVGALRPGRLAGNEAPLIVDSKVVADVLGAVADADVVVAARYHGILLSLANGKPVLALCYHHKSTELMADAGLADFAIWIDRMDPAAMRRAVLDLFARRDALRSELESVAARNWTLLERQYADILALMPPAKDAGR